MSSTQNHSILLGLGSSHPTCMDESVKLLPSMPAYCFAISWGKNVIDYTPSRFQRLQISTIGQLLECVCIKGWDEGETIVRMYAKLFLLFSTVPIKSHSRDKIHVTHFREELQSILALL